MFNIVKSAYAAPVDLGGGITGVGPFQNILSAGGVKSQTGVFISALIGTITVVGGLAFLVYFFMGALKWITAGGDKAKVGEAQASMTQGAVGLIALVAAYFIIGIIGGVLGLDILNPISVLFPGI